MTTREHERLFMSNSFLKYGPWALVRSLYGSGAVRIERLTSRRAVICDLLRITPVEQLTFETVTRGGKAVTTLAAYTFVTASMVVGEHSREFRDITAWNPCIF